MGNLCGKCDTCKEYQSLNRREGHECDNCNKIIKSKKDCIICEGYIKLNKRIGETCENCNNRIGTYDQLLKMSSDQIKDKWFRCEYQNVIYNGSMYCGIIISKEDYKCLVNVPFVIKIDEKIEIMNDNPNYGKRWIKFATENHFIEWSKLEHKEYEEVRRASEWDKVFYTINKNSSIICIVEGTIDEYLERNSPQIEATYIDIVKPYTGYTDKNFKWNLKNPKKIIGTFCVVYDWIPESFMRYIDYKRMEPLINIAKKYNKSVNDKWSFNKKDSSINFFKDMQQNNILK